MELYEANRILRSVKSAIAADGYKLPASAETDGLMLLLDRLDLDKFLAPKIKRARASGVKSGAASDAVYNYIAFFRALQAVKSVSVGTNVTAVTAMMLHKTLFGDLDPSAGKPRSAELITGGNAHTDPKYISGSIKSIASKMNEITGAPMTAKEDFAGYLSHYMRELLILHPFDRGSNFTARVFAIIFCRVKGFDLAYYRVGIKTIEQAEDAAFAADDVTPLFKLFAECLSYDHKSTTQNNVSTPPRTRREVAKDLCRPTRPSPNSTKKQSTSHARKKNGNGLSEEEVLKRAVRLQQKISKLNEQLTELIQPLGNKDN